MKALSPYQKTLALKRQIKAAEAEMRAMKDAADLDRAVRGLRACGRAKVTFDFDHVNEVCVCGDLIGPISGYEVSKLFDFEDYHAYITCMIDGMSMSIATNDGKVSIQIGFQERIKQEAALAAKLKVICALLKKHGMKMTAKDLIVKRDNLLKDVAEANSLIQAVEQA